MIKDIFFIWAALAVISSIMYVIVFWGSKDD